MGNQQQKSPTVKHDGGKKTQDLGMFTGHFGHSSRSTFVRSNTMLDEKTWLTVSAVIYLKNCSVWITVSPTKLFLCKLSHPCFLHHCAVILCQGLNAAALSWKAIPHWTGNRKFCLRDLCPFRKKHWNVRISYNFCQERLVSPNTGRLISVLLLSVQPQKTCGCTCGLTFDMSNVKHLTYQMFKCT